jgi:hypothetical protein
MLNVAKRYERRFTSLLNHLAVKPMAVMDVEAQGTELGWGRGPFLVLLCME